MFGSIEEVIEKGEKLKRYISLMSTEKGNVRLKKYV